MAGGIQLDGLSDDECTAFGADCAELLLPGNHWIHRRREAIEVIDETSLMRRISVDFTLPETRSNGEQWRSTAMNHGFPAPLFALPKAPARLMSFDVVNASGTSLPLMTRHENGKISGQALCAMASLVLEVPASDQLQEQLGQIASLDPPASETLARILLNADRASAPSSELQTLLAWPGPRPRVDTHLT
jgi:hypothetical protein